MAKSMLIATQWQIRIIGLLILGGIAFGCNPLPSSPRDFTYQVRVQDQNTQENISHVEVRIEIGGDIAPLEESTDSKGLARFFIDRSYVGKPGRLIIDADGYKPFRLSIDLRENGFPFEAQIAPLKLDVLGEVAKVNPAPKVNTRTPTSTPENKKAPTPTPTAQVEDTFICVTPALEYGSYHTLLQIVEEELDKQNGFNLKVIAWDLEGPDGNGDVLWKELPDKLRSGEWDCLLDTLDGHVHDDDYGAITAIIGESAGADEVWVSEGIETVNDFKGKRIIFFADSVSEFMLYGLLDLVGLDKDDIVPLEETGVLLKEMIAKFNRGEADVLVGWGDDLELEIKGHKLLDSSEFRYFVDVITISHQAIESKPDTVQAFHKAWFQALKIQAEDFEQAARSIAGWGDEDLKYKEWMGVYTDTAVADLKSLLEDTPQAGYGPNLIIMQNPEIVYDRLEHAREIWSLNESPPPFDVHAAVAPQFVLNLQGDSDIKTQGKPYNADFSMAGRPFSTISSDILKPESVIATLPCETFEFIPDTTQLTEEAKEMLEDCVLPRIKPSTLYIHITGSSAWPKGRRYSEADIKEFAHSRALVVQQYLANHGIDPNRFIVDSVVPPPERRELTNEAELKKDRFVRLELIRPGQR